MAGRAWYFGPVELHLTVFGPNSLEQWTLGDYVGGVLDTLDGSSGQTFTYLPVVFEDDCQACDIHAKWLKSSEISYRIDIFFK